MKLESFFQIMQPFLEGRLAADAARSALYGDRAREIDLDRLALYPNNYRYNVFRCAEHVFPVTRRSIVTLYGESVWRSLMNAYAVRFPMPEIAFGTARLPQFIREENPHIAPWLADVADLEEWERRITIAPPPAPAASTSVTARLLADPMELRDYEYAVLPWMTAGGDVAAPPARRYYVVELWRPRSTVKMRLIGPIAMWLLQAVADGRDIADCPPALGTRDDVTRAWETLVRIELVREAADADGTHQRQTNGGVPLARLPALPEPEPCVK